MVRAAAAIILVSACWMAGCSGHKPVAAVKQASEISAPEYAQRTRERELAILQQQLTTIESKTTERGIVLTIPDVLFEGNRADLKASAQRDLVAIATYLKERPGQKTLIEGHTDSTGTESHNQELSLRRGTAVETFFLRHGVDPNQVDVRGLGEDDPVASNATATGRRQNRRVEIVMLNASGPRTMREERVIRYGGR